MTATQPTTSALEQFQWKPQPEAAKIVRELITDFLARCPGAANLAERMKRDTGTRFIDWIDHIHAPRSGDLVRRLVEAGFDPRPVPGAPECFIHDGGIFPQIVLEASGSITRVAVKVDSVADFLAAWRIPPSQQILGEPWSPIRLAPAFAGDRAELWAIERHGFRGFAVPPFSPAQGVAAMKHHENFRRRARDFAEDAQGFAHAHQLVDAAVADLGVDWACDLWFYAEREFWQRRNRAAQVQKGRQDRLGLGWANHDHHTYRSGRQCFPHLVAFFEKLGFRCRERFYAGAEAGWGAQVIEQPTTGITIFADVDMSPEELLGDFSHTPMQPRKELGTVGLWCALHGEAFLQAGMHHLECQFDWYALKDQLQSEAQIKTMDPFTSFPFLRQAFTEGERWPVDPARVERLLARGQITREQADQFRTGGALGSHLENLERNDGYKGFNQQGVSAIISKTDPRKQQVARSGA